MKSQSQSSGILSAFSRDAIRGAIYVEATQRSDVVNIARGLHGVLHSRRIAYGISLVRLSPEECASLLSMGDYPTSIVHGSWVRIKHHRRHRLDLAFVLQLDEGTLMARVAVVPRIKLDRKRPRRRKIRSTPLLFDPNKVRELYGDKSLTQCGNGWIFRRNEYHGGLLVLFVNLFELSNININPTLEEIYPFRGSQDRTVAAAAAALSSTLKLTVNDKVKIIVGELQGSTGRLAEIHDDGTVTIVADDEQIPPLNLLRWEICKLFSQGDFIRVLFGEHRGKEGFIVDLEGNSATIYYHIFLPGGGAGSREYVAHREVDIFSRFNILYLLELPSLVCSIH